MIVDIEETVDCQFNRLLEEWKEMKPGEKKEIVRAELHEISEMAMKNCIKYGAGKTV